MQIRYLTALLAVKLHCSGNYFRIIDSFELGDGGTAQAGESAEVAFVGCLRKDR